MTQSEAGERKRTLVAVRSAESAPGQYGPQWALVVAYPWMRAGRTAKAWIPRDEFGAAPEPGQYSCLVEKGSKWATDSPGDEDWQYNWRLIGGLSGVEDAPATEATVAPKPIAPLPAVDPSQDMTNRRTALMSARETVPADDRPLAERLSDVAEATLFYYRVLNSLTLETPQDARTEEKPAPRHEDMVEPMPMDGTDEPFPV